MPDVVNLFNTNLDIKTRMQNATYNSGNNFTANITPTITCLQGTWHNYEGYLYFAIADNTIVRLTKS